MRPATLWLAVGALALTVLAGAGPAAAKPPSADAQLKFGVDMAKRGLWAEALFRFEQAHRLDASNGRVLNNLAVAYEAVGRFEDALEMYRKALAANPGSRDLKKNYSQFLEFYQAFRPPDPQAEGTPAEGAGNEESATDSGSPEPGSPAAAAETSEAPGRAARSAAG